MYIMHSYLLSHKHEQVLLKHILKKTKFQGQKHFSAKCVQMGYKNNFHQFKSFCLSNHQC